MNTYAITTSQGVLSAMVDTPDDFVNIDSKIVALKLAAIDAYMYYYSWERKGDHYEPSMTNITEMPTIFDVLDHPPRVTRPGPNGEGGGDWSCSNWAIGKRLFDGWNDKSYGEAFDQIRTRIDDAIAPWKPSFPIHWSIQAEADTGWQAISEISTGSVKYKKIVDKGGTDGDSEETTSPETPGLVEAFDGVKTDCNTMKGNFADSIKLNFYDNLRGVTNNLRDAAIYWNSSLNAEAAIFKEVRKSVSKVIDDARSACETLASGGNPPSLIATLKLVDAVAKLATATGQEHPDPGSVTSAVTQTAIATIELNDSMDVDIEGDGKGAKAGDYDDVLKFVESSLKSISEKMRTAESAVESSINSKLDEMSGEGKSSYDLQFEPVTDSSEFTKVDDATLKRLSTNRLPTISGHLRTCADKIMSVSMSNVVIRNVNCGYGAYGPSGVFEEMRETLGSLLYDLAWEVENGAANIETGRKLTESADEDNRNAFDQKLRDIADKKDKKSDIDMGDGDRWDLS